MPSKHHNKSNKISQNYYLDTILEINQLTVKDSGVFPILDTAIFYNEKCPYFIGGLMSFFYIFISDQDSLVRFSVVSEQKFDGFLLHRFSDYGCFYYKGYVFLVVPNKISEVVSAIFNLNMKEKEYINIHFRNKPILYPDNSKLPYHVRLNYYYVNRNFLFDDRSFCK